MSTKESPNYTYLILRLSVSQQTDHIQSSLSRGYCYEGEFYGAYELQADEEVIPLLVVEGMDNETDSLGSSHLQVTTVPKAQVGGQCCTPFAGGEISSLFKKFVSYRKSKIDFTMPEEVKPDQYKNVYIPKKLSGLMRVEKHITKQRGARYLRWGLTGHLVLDRRGRGYTIDEPVMTFDPEVIVDTGDD